MQQPRGWTLSTWRHRRTPVRVPPFPRPFLPSAAAAGTGEDVPAPRHKASCPQGTEVSSRNPPEPRGKAGPNSRVGFQSKAQGNGDKGQDGRQGHLPHGRGPREGLGPRVWTGQCRESEEGLQDPGSCRVFWAPGRAHPTESGGQAEGPWSPVPYPRLHPLQMGRLRDSPE